jgi:site-specific DNA recombinase
MTSDFELLEALASDGLSAADQETLLQEAKRHAIAWAKETLLKKYAFLNSALERIVVKVDCVDIILNQTELKLALIPNDGTRSARNNGPTHHQDADAFITLTAMAKLIRCGLEVKLVVEGGEPKQEARINQALVKASARGRNWYEKLTSSNGMSLNELAQEYGVNDRYASRILRFAFLAPDIIEAFLEGRQSKGMTLKKAFSDMPLNWDKQRRIFNL